MPKKDPPPTFPGGSAPIPIMESLPGPLPMETLMTGLQSLQTKVESTQAQNATMQA